MWHRHMNFREDRWYYYAVKSPGINIKTQFPHLTNGDINSNYQCIKHIAWLNLTQSTC